MVVVTSSVADVASMVVDTIVADVTRILKVTSVNRLLWTFFKIKLNV